jgi:hypothetical protein
MARSFFLCASRDEALNFQRGTNDPLFGGRTATNKGYWISFSVKRFISTELMSFSGDKNGGRPWLSAVFAGARLLGRGEVDLVGELLEEDGLGDCALGDLVGAAGVDNGDVRDADEAEDYIEVGAFEVVGLEG